MTPLEDAISVLRDRAMRAFGPAHAIKLRRARLDCDRDRLLLALASTAAAADPAAPNTAVPDLRRDVQPMLRARCVKCHSVIKKESGLNLSSPRSIARGGESGAPVVPGQPDESLLWERIETDENAARATADRRREEST